MDDMNELVPAAMQIILHAGDARNYAADALDAAKKFEFEEAAINMDKARSKLTEAHKSQTEIIQAEASGQSYEYSLLFTHAQDTLMTIQSELRLTDQLIDVLKMLPRATAC